MPKFRNVSPLGALELPLLDSVVPAGEVIDVTDDQAELLAGQVDTWEPVDDAASLAQALALAAFAPPEPDVDAAAPMSTPDQEA